MSYDEFLTQFSDGTNAEWVNGEVVFLSPVSWPHADLNGFLIGVLKGFVSMYQLGQIIVPPFQMKLPTSGREPDVIFLSTARALQLKHTYIDEPADLVIEIESPESVERDRIAKFREYEVGGVPEYWRFEPEGRQAAFYQRDEAGQYQSVSVDTDGVYRSRSLPGFWLRVDWLWQDPLPDVARVLFTIDRSAYTRYLDEQANRHDL
jgi:Uma2 family endonuclease